MPPYISPDTPPPPTTIVPWVTNFPLDDLHVIAVESSTRAPTAKTFIVFEDLPRKGIRVVPDRSLNDRLREILYQNIQAEAPVSARDRSKEETAREAVTEKRIESEANLSTVMEFNFFPFSTTAIRLGLPSEPHGFWKTATDSGSGTTDWVFKLDAKKDVQDDTGVLAIMELKLPSVLTKVVEPKKSSKKRKGEGAASRKKPEVSRLQQLEDACKGKQGLRVVLTETAGSGQLALTALDQNGDPDDDLSHWASGLAQLWEQLVKYKLTLVTLCSYDVWIPFECDSDELDILRMGEPIHRTQPGTAPPAGTMTPMELSMAVVLPRPRTTPLSRKFEKLPVLTSSGPKVMGKGKQQEAKTKNLKKSTGQQPASRPSQKRGSGQDDSDGRGDFPGYGALPGSGEQLLVFALDVNVPGIAVLNARHFFLQSSLDDSDLAGCVRPSIASGDSVLTPNPTANLALVRYLGSGRLWDAYAAVLSGDGLRTMEVIAKVTCPYTYDEGNPSTQELFEDSREAKQAYLRETELYRGPLAKLQGGAVPMVYGSFEGVMCISLGIHRGFEIFVELMENVGEPADEDEDLWDLPIEDKLEIEGLYRQLHAVRVVHWDVEPRHIRRRADGRFALIDFDSSREVKPGREGDEQLASEARRVRKMLGLPDRPVPTKAATPADYHSKLYDHMGPVIAVA